MSLELKVIATAQGVGSSTAVACRTTPFVANDSAVATITPSAGSDRNWVLEKSEDNGATFVTTGVSGSGASQVRAQVKMGDKMRLTVSGGSAGTVSADIVA